MEETITIKKSELTKIIRDEVARAVKNGTNGKAASIKWEDITTFEQVCQAAGEDPKDYEIPDGASKREKGRLLFAALELICDVFKQGVILDYEDGDQYKYYPWGEYKKGSGFALCDVDCTDSDTYVGARLCVDTKAKSEHIWKHFNHIYQRYWLDK